MEIAANPKVELCYVDSGHNQVRITGTAEVVTVRAMLQEIWDANALLRQYLGSIDNPQLIVYCVRPVQVRYMQEWALEYMNVPFEISPGKSVMRYLRAWRSSRRTAVFATGFNRVDSCALRELLSRF